MGGVGLAEVEEERDVGLVMHKSLKQAAQCIKASNTASVVLRQICQNFHFRDRYVFRYLRTHLEFSTQAWLPWLKGDIDM